MQDVFRFLTAGESHGEALTAVIDGVPLLEKFAGDSIDEIRRNYAGDTERPKSYEPC